MDQERIDEERERLIQNLNRSMDELELSVRAYNQLKNADIPLVGDLVQQNETEMLKSRMFGRKNIKEIKDLLGGMGLSLGMDLSDLEWRRASVNTRPSVPPPAEEMNGRKDDRTMLFAHPTWITGEIQPGPFYIKFIKRLSEIVRDTNSGDSITVFINSHGGDTHTSLGIYDLLKTCGRSVTGLVAGRAKSGASLILQACERRIMTDHSTLTLHKSSIEMPNIPMTDAQSTLNSLRELDQQFYEIYCSRSGRQFTELRHGKICFNAWQAVHAGLADEIHLTRSIEESVKMGDTIRQIAY